MKKNGNSVDKRQKTGDLDGLTAVLKADIAERQIRTVLSRERGGTLFLCDMDDMEKINWQYGHLKGDECLKQMAEILSYMVRPEDILGRYGGDEFLIFMPGCRDMRQAQEICMRMENRFRRAGGNDGKGISFSVTVVWALWQSGDTIKKLFERVEEKLEEHKTASGGTKKQKKGRQDHYVKDVRRVRKELMEQIRESGAYCQDYETFKSIYRFLERGIIRSGQKACVILITVVDGQGASLLPREKDVRMEQLGEDIGTTLRIGDVYTRYSSSQYLLLVIDTTEGQADRIVNRIREQFLAHAQEDNILIHHCYELQPAQTEALME